MGENWQEAVDIVQEYEDVFRGTEKLKLHVDTNAEGVVQKQRRISIPLKDKCDELLNKWQELDIIEDAGEEPTEWCRR